MGGSGREWKRGNCGILLGLSWFTEWVEVEEDLGLSEVALGCEKREALHLRTMRGRRFKLQKIAKPFLGEISEVASDYIWLSS